MAGKPAGGGTPATDALTAAGVPFILHPYTHHDDSRDYGAEAARELGVDELQIFKTLVVDVGIRRSPLAVGIVPVAAQLGEPAGPRLRRVGVAGAPGGGTTASS